MKAIRTHWPRLMVLTCFMLGYTASFAQKPVIAEVDKVSAANGEVVTLQGAFNDDDTQVAVSFGGAKGNIKFASDQFLEVAVPPGATYENIVVTDLTSGLSAQSRFPFLYSFGGNHGIIAPDLESQVDFSSERGLYDLCMCDFDGDGKTDVATANDNSSSMTILTNGTASPGRSNITFTTIPRLIGRKSIHASCGDLNGDGKPDLVVSEDDGDQLFFFRNTSTGPGVVSFSVQAITITGKKAKRTDIADLDNDGRPEVIVTNKSENNITILVNQSTTASIAFSPTPITLTVANAASTDGLAVEDLDGDGLPEIVVNQFLTQTSNIFIFKNTSLPGNISMTYNQTLLIDGTVVNLKIGDLDGDGKPEIAATQLISSGSSGTVSIFRNQTSGAISFAPLASFTTGPRPWGLDFGDIDGDGLADIVIASIDKSVTVLNNKSTAGTLNFSTLVLPTTFTNRHVIVGDVDGDAKPDIVFTSVDDYSSGTILASKISVIRNKSCLVPEVDPAGSMTICTGFPLQLTTTESRGTNYQWLSGSTTVSNGADAFFDVTVSGSYKVVATGEGGYCSETSNTVSVTVDPGTTNGDPVVPENDGPVCPGGTLTLEVNNVAATGYEWTGPNGYTGSGLIPAPVTNFQKVNAGRYYVDIVVNGCIAEQASTVVEMVSVPEFQISYAGSDVICPPDTKTLTVVPYDPDFTYQWSERSTGDIGGATGETVTVNATGDYFVKATYLINPACVDIETPDATITFSAPPTVDFIAPATACTSQVIDFTNQSTGTSSATLTYEWNFGDSQTSTNENPTYQYTAPGTYTVRLKASYDGACENQTSKTITIQTAPTVAITTSTNEFSICSGDTLQLGVNGTFQTYQWSTGDTSPAIDISLPGNYSVDVFNGTCLLTAATTIDSLPGPIVVAAAEPAVINEGGSSQLSATGLETYLWDPAASLNDETIANPVAKPAETTLYTVVGTDADGCPGTATVEVSVKGDLIVNKLGPSKFISPDNGDSMNNFWLVEKILDYPQCSITIYDDKGVKVYDAKPYNNDWAGTFNGKQLPDGVYFYVIRCDGEENTPRSGSITILR